MRSPGSMLSPGGRRGQESLEFLSGLKGAFGAGSERSGGVGTGRGSGRARGYALQGLLFADLRQPRPHFLIGTLDFLPLGIGGGGELGMVRRRLAQRRR